MHLLMSNIIVVVVVVVIVVVVIMGMLVLCVSQRGAPRRHLPARADPGGPRAQHGDGPLGCRLPGRLLLQPVRAHHPPPRHHRRDECELVALLTSYQHHFDGHNSTKNKLVTVVATLFVILIYLFVKKIKTFTVVL